jgi:CRP/FNR family transcriptional regulator, cyclic AMP receptor protein
LTSPQNVHQLLAASWLFTELEPNVLRDLARSAHQRQVHRGDVLMHCGSADADLYVVVSGLFKVSVPTRDGKDIALNLLGPGDICGELTLLDGGRRSATVSCLDAGDVVIVRRLEFLAALHRSPDTAIRLLQRLAGLVRSLSERTEERATLGIGQRLARRLLDLADRCGTVIAHNQVALRLKLPQRELGELVQGTRESVNKWLGKWADQGIVYQTHDQIVICDRDRLRAEAAAPSRR